MGGLPSSTGQLPSAADGSRIDAIPNGRIASAANTNGRAGRWGGPPSTYAMRSRCCISGPSAPVRPAVRLRSTRCGPCQSAAWDARRYLGTCVFFRGCVSGPSAPALPAGCGAGPLRGAGGAYQGPRHLRPLPLPPCLEAWGPRHLRYPPLTQFAGGRPPPCPTECPRSRRCPRRGRWRPRSPVLRRAPRPSTCSGR